jgi:hypothetical protein
MLNGESVCEGMEIAIGQPGNKCSIKKLMLKINTNVQRRNIGLNKRG